MLERPLDSGPAAERLADRHALHVEVACGVPPRLVDAEGAQVVERLGDARAVVQLAPQRQRLLEALLRQPMLAARAGDSAKVVQGERLASPIAARAAQRSAL